MSAERSPGELPLLKVHPVVRAARDAFDAGDHRAARRHLVGLDRGAVTLADQDALARLDAGLQVDAAPWIVALVCLAGWLALFLRAA